MYKVIAFSFAIIFSTVAVAQQTTANKSTMSLPNNDVQISAVAIPFNEAGNVVIDPSTYHKAVELGSSQESSMQEVEISASATHVTEHAPGNTPKVSVGNEKENSGKETIHKSDRAQKVILKCDF